MRRDLYSGITATRIMADDLRSIAELDRAARAGEIPGPDLYYAALVAGTELLRRSAHRRGRASATRPATAPWAQAIDAGTDIPLAIARARGTGAAALKIYADLPPELVRRLAAEAHRQGLHGLGALRWSSRRRRPRCSPPAPTSSRHTCYLAYQAMARRPADLSRPRPGRSRAVRARRQSGDGRPCSRTMRARGILLDATLRVYREGERRATPASARPIARLDLAARLTAQARRAGVLRLGRHRRRHAAATLPIPPCSRRWSCSSAAPASPRSRRSARRPRSAR